MGGLLKDRFVMFPGSMTATTAPLVADWKLEAARHAL